MNKPTFHNKGVIEVKLKTITQQYLTGERALFKAHDLEINNTTFADGESPLKESRNVTLKQPIFKWKYPLWYSQHVTVDQGLFETMSALASGTLRILRLRIVRYRHLSYFGGPAKLS